MVHEVLVQNLQDELRRCQKQAKNSIFSDGTRIAIRIPLFTCSSDMSRMEVIVFDRVLTIYIVFCSHKVLRCPMGIDLECYVMSGFRRHIGLCNTLGLDVTLVSIQRQTRLFVESMFVVGAQSKKKKSKYQL